MNQLLTQFIRFTGVGTVGTLAHYGVLILLVQGMGLDVVMASTAGFIVGALINYVLNYHYTFASKKLHREAMSKFFTVALIGMLFNGVIMALCSNVLDLHYLLAQILATGLVLLWGFSANRWWTFRECESYSNNSQDK